MDVSCNKENCAGNPCSSSSCVKTILRFLTYLCPSLPLGLFQTYQYYLEDVLRCESSLCIESRSSAPLADRVDPFTSDLVDIAFMCSTGYVTMSDSNDWMELLPVAPVHIYSPTELRSSTESRPVYFSDVIVRKETAKICKDFSDLRGFKFAVSDAMSLTGNISVRAELKKMGVNASFFGHLVHSGSHLESIELVRNAVADAAAVDSIVLSNWRAEHSERSEELAVLCSLGPFPVQPIVVNKRLSADMKAQIVSALLNIEAHPKYSEMFLKYGVKGFARIENNFYDITRQTIELASEQTLNPAYY